MAYITEDNVHCVPYLEVLCRRAMTGGALATTAFAILNSGAAATALPAFPTGEALEVVSSNAADGSAGTGIRTVRVIYIVGTTGAISSEVITMNGTTPVPLVQTSVTRVLGVHGLTFGSNDAAVGTVTVQVASAGATRMSIEPMFKSAMPGRYTVPTGMKGYYRGFVPENGTHGTAPASIEYVVRADILSNTGALSTNNFIDIDYGVRAPAGPTGSGRPSSVHGRNIVLPAGTTIMALGRHEAAGSVILGGRFFIELITQI